MSPPQVKACSFWEFQAAVSGWNDVHGAEDKPGVLTPQDEEDLWQGIKDRMH